MSLFTEFKRRFDEKPDAIWQQIFADNKDTIKIKKEKFVLPNLQAIITSTIELSNRTGFRAMSLRDLSNDTGISMGALYSYIESKKRLMEMILGHVLRAVETTLGAEEVARLEPRPRLNWLLRNHVYLSEVMQPWFFFAYMEAKSFDRVGKRLAIENELRTEGILAACIAAGTADGVFRPVDPLATAALIKPLLQDWYLKRWKHRRREVGPDAYAERIIAFVEAFLLDQGTQPASRPRSKNRRIEDNAAAVAAPRALE